MWRLYEQIRQRLVLRILQQGRDSDLGAASQSRKERTKKKTQIGKCNQEEKTHSHSRSSTKEKEGLCMWEKTRQATKRDNEKWKSLPTEQAKGELTGNRLSISKLHTLATCKVFS